MSDNFTEEDLTKIDKIKSCVTGIELKPHVKYIRYLMTKRYLPRYIRTELQRLALSAPHEPNATTYYLAVIDPLIKKYKLQSLYSDYKSRMMQQGNKGRYIKNVLNYSIDISELGDKDMAKRFLHFIKELEVDSLWLREIYCYYGSAKNFPRDENGETIIKTTSAKKDVEKILCHPQRYLIDKFVLEGISTEKIVDHCNGKLNMQVNQYDISLYKKTVFSFRTNVIEEKIKALEKEKSCLKEDVDLIESKTDDEMSKAERSRIVTQSERRLEELEMNIRDLNKYYTDYAYRAAVSDMNDTSAAFQDMFARAYTRFCDLDKYKDRDVVDPMYKVARIITTVFDKVTALQDQKGSSPSDKHSQGVMIDLYKKRSEQINAEELERANKELKSIGDEMGIAGIEPLEEVISMDDISGIEELGVSFEVKNDQEE